MAETESDSQHPRQPPPPFPLVQRVFALTEQLPARTVAGSNWTVRQKQAFDLLDLYGDP